LSRAEGTKVLPYPYYSAAIVARVYGRKILLFASHGRVLEAVDYTEQQQRPNKKVVEIWGTYKGRGMTNC
jgi:hypothetical protein